MRNDVAVMKATGTMRNSDGLLDVEQVESTDEIKMHTNNPRVQTLCCCILQRSLSQDERVIRGGTDQIRYAHNFVFVPAENAAE